MAFFAGRTAYITVGGTSVPLKAWTIAIKCEVVDVTNFASAMYQENVAGINSADITADGPYNGSAGTGATAGASVTFVLAVGGAGPSFSVTARISDITIKTDVRGVAEISYQAASTGVFTLTY